MNILKMKKFLFASMVLTSVLLTSCGLHSALTHNANNSNTEVILAKNNFKVVKTVRGEASTFTVFGFGGIRSDVLARAREEMLRGAELEGKSRALINERIEIHRSTYLFVGTYTITVSAEVVEFTE